MHSSEGVPVKTHTVVYEQDKCALLLVSLVKLVAFGLAIASIVICGTQLQYASLSVQYVVLSSFFFGVFGSFIFSHFIYAFLQLALSSFYKRVYLEKVDGSYTFFSFFSDTAILAYLNELRVLHQAIEETNNPDLTTKRRATTPANIARKENSGFQESLENQASS